MIIKSYRNYLFDADGTLINTAELVFQTFLYTCEKYGRFTIERSRVLADMGQPLVRQIQLYLGRLLENELVLILEDFREYQLSIYQAHLEVFPDVYETLHGLQAAGKRLAVVTSRKMETTELYLKIGNLFDFFDVIITPEATSKHKPDPEPALKAMELINGDPDDTLFIGDAYFDIQCGQQAGTDTALVSWSQNDVNTIQPSPTYILQNMTDLLD